MFCKCGLFTFPALGGKNLHILRSEHSMDGQVCIIAYCSILSPAPYQVAQMIGDQQCQSSIMPSPPWLCI